MDNWQSIAKNLVELIQGVIRSMKEDGYLGRTVTVMIRFADFKTYTRAKSLDTFTDSEPEVRRVAFQCLGRFELKKKVRLIGFRMSNLEKEGYEDSN